jgi:transcriptional regulator GlxA family with amidase domain
MTTDRTMSAEVETPYSVSEVCKLTGLSARIVTRLFEHERGVIVYESTNPQRKRKNYRSIRVPRHVYERVMRYLAVQ